MTTALDCGNAALEWAYGDTANTLTFRLSIDGAPADLTDATAHLLLQPDDDDLVTCDLDIVNAQRGVVSFTPEGDEHDPAWGQLQVVVTYQDTTILHFPNTRALPRYRITEGLDYTE